MSDVIISVKDVSSPDTLFKSHDPAPAAEVATADERAMPLADPDTTVESTEPEASGDSSTKLVKIMHRCSRIGWEAFDCEYGHMEAESWDVDPLITARVDIWACSKSEAYPKGYFFALGDPNKPYLGAEPGDLSNNKHLICKIIFTGVSSVTEKVSEDAVAKNGGRTYHIEYMNPRFDKRINRDDLLPQAEIIGDDVEITEALAIGEPIPASPKELSETVIPTTTKDTK